jgi:hypothetical protein
MFVVWCEGRWKEKSDEEAKKKQRVGLVGDLILCGQSGAGIFKMRRPCIICHRLCLKRAKYIHVIVPISVFILHSPTNVDAKHIKHTRRKREGKR